jgi:nascent polypeptide-associated complex subunit alpha
VIIQTSSEEIIIEKPIVSVMELQNQKVFQITGGSISEKTSEKISEIPEEDMHLVAQQAGVSLERAKEALKQTNGDLAQAILLLTSKK